MNINEIMLTVASEIARDNGYILADERVIIGKKIGFGVTGRLSLMLG